MPFCEFQSDNVMFDVTPVENLFIMEYMLTAPGEFVRVYLLGLAMCYYPQKDNTISGMAKALHLPEEDVYSAMQYWERQGLVIRASDNPPAYRYIPARTMAGGGVNPENDAYKYKEFFGTITMKFNGQPLDPRHWEDVTFWLETLKLPENVILLMIEAEFERAGGKRRKPDTVFKHLNETAQRWAEDGVTTAEAAKLRIIRDGETGQIAQQVAHSMGFRRPPTDPEITMADKWLHDWRYTRADIMQAMEKTTAASSPSFAYLDSILARYADRAGTFAERSSCEEGTRTAAARILRILGGNAVPGEAETAGYAGLIEEGFPDEMIAAAAARCASSSRARSMDNIGLILHQWKDSGIATMEDLEQQKKDSDFLRGLFVRAGSEKRPKLSDLQNLNKWRETMPDEVILLAADAAHGAHDPASYMAKIIEIWTKSGISTAEAASADIASHRSKPAAGGGTAPAPRADFEQREYDDEFFKSLNDDPMRFLNPEGKDNDAQ